MCLDSSSKRLLQKKQMNETGHEMFATLLHPVGLANRQGLSACLDFPIKHLFQQYAVSANKRIQTWPNKTSNLAKSVFLLGSYRTTNFLPSRT